MVATPVATTPWFAFWYDIQQGKFVRHILSFNHLPWYPGVKNQNPVRTGRSEWA